MRLFYIAAVNIILLLSTSLNANAQSQWQQKGKDITGEMFYNFAGVSICMPDNNTIAVGASTHNTVKNPSKVHIYKRTTGIIEAGQVRVFHWNDSTQTWIQKGADIEGEAPFDHLGESVSMPDANTLAVGIPNKGDSYKSAGQVRVYHWNDSARVWMQKGNNMNGKAENNSFGIAVNMPNENTLAVSSQQIIDGKRENICRVRVFYWKDSSWVQKGNYIVSDTLESNPFGDCFISMPDANTLAIGDNAPVQSHIYKNKASRVRIYHWNGGAWIQKGNDIVSEVTGGYSGCVVSMPSADVIAIGTPGDNKNGKEAGEVRVFYWNGKAWLKKGKNIDGKKPGESLGESVSMPNANTLAVSIPYDDAEFSKFSPGRIRIYTWNGNKWVPKGADINGKTFNNWAGYSISMPDAHTVAFGDPVSGVKGKDTGLVRVYHWEGKSSKRK